MTVIDPRPPAPALVIENEQITAPIPRAASDAIEEVAMRHQEELIEALAPFGLHPYDLVKPEYRRIVRPGETNAPTSEDAMTRKEAVEELICAWMQKDGEFCVGESEHHASDQELRAALHALGVTDEEMGA